VLDERTSRGSLLALASFQALITAGSGVMLSFLLGAERSPSELVLPLLLLAGGAAIGCAVASLQGHPRRCLGLVPLGTTGLLLALVWTCLVGRAQAAPCLVIGFMGGLVNVPLRATYLAAVPADARGNATAIMNAAIYVATIALALSIIGLSEVGLLTSPVTQLGALVALTTTGAAAAWYRLYGQVMEVLVEIALLPLYRIRAHGPGARRLPTRGPLLIVSNHAAYLDPFWIAKVVPRQIRPMMTSAFYDLPVISWLSRHVARAIRVPTGAFRREAPELQEAIAALQAGECVVIFPEGLLRRSEEDPLRPFGRGLWNILHALPETPVCICWIEGNWGSYFSYEGGPPGKNKRLDRFRPIDIALSDPRPVDPSILSNHHTTRTRLRQAVLEARTYLGLPALEIKQVHSETSEQAAETQAD
jgi:1-acyl-sn-glycerol-3-phosphate acyltransferase